MPISKIKDNGTRGANSTGTGGIQVATSSTGQLPKSSNGTSPQLQRKADAPRLLPDGGSRPHTGTYGSRQLSSDMLFRDSAQQQQDETSKGEASGDFDKDLARKLGQVQLDDTGRAAFVDISIASNVGATATASGQSNKTQSMHQPAFTVKTRSRQGTVTQSKAVKNRSRSNTTGNKLSEGVSLSAIPAKVLGDSLENHPLFRGSHENIAQQQGSQDGKSPAAQRKDPGKRRVVEALDQHPLFASKSSREHLADGASKLEASLGSNNGISGSLSMAHGLLTGLKSKSGSLLDMASTSRKASQDQLAEYDQVYSKIKKSGATSSKDDLSLDQKKNMASRAAEAIALVAEKPLAQRVHEMMAQQNHAINQPSEIQKELAALKERERAAAALQAAEEEKATQESQQEPVIPVIKPLAERLNEIKAQTDRSSDQKSTIQKELEMLKQTDRDAKSKFEVHSEHTESDKQHPTNETIPVTKPLAQRLNEIKSQADRSSGQKSNIQKELEQIKQGEGGAAKRLTALQTRDRSDSQSQSDKVRKELEELKESNLGPIAARRDKLNLPFAMPNASSTDRPAVVIPKSENMAGAKGALEKLMGGQKVAPKSTPKAARKSSTDKALPSIPWIPPPSTPGLPPPPPPMPTSSGSSVSASQSQQYEPEKTSTRSSLSTKPLPNAASPRERSQSESKSLPPIPQSSSIRGALSPTRSDSKSSDISGRPIDDSASVLAEDEAIKQIKDAIHKTATMHTRPMGATANRSIIVNVIQSQVKQTPEQLDVEEGDVLLIINQSDPVWWMARHEGTQRTGLVRASNVKEMDTFFAEIVALAEEEDKLIDLNENGAMRKSPSHILAHRDSGSNSSGIMDYWKSDVPESTMASKYPHLSELAKTSKFNVSIEQELLESGGGRRSRTPTMENFSWAKRVGEDVMKIIEKEDKKRQEAIYEYIETEKGFVDDIAMIMDGYVKPLKDNFILSEEEIEELFSNLPEILSVSSEISAKLTERQMSSNGLVDRIGDILLTQLPRYKHLAPFCSNISHAIGFVAAKKKKSPQFAEKLAECAKHPYFGNLDLNSFMLKPMQRITKIPLLIKGILKHTRQDHPDYKELMHAQTFSEEILLYINTKCGEADEMRKLEKTQLQLNEDLLSDLGYGFFDRKKRRVLYGGTLECNDRKVKMFLFDDVCVLTTSKTVNKAEKYSLYRPVMSLWLLELPDNGKNLVKRPTRVTKPKSNKDPQKSFMVFDIAMDVTYEFSFNTIREKETWESRLSRTQRNLITNRSRFLIDRIKAVPVHHVNQKSKKPQSIDYHGSIKIENYIVLAHDNGLLCTTDDEQTSFIEPPGFMAVNTHSISLEPSQGLIFMNVGPDRILEAYLIDSFRLLLEQMFHPKPGSMPGVKLIKFGESENTRYYVSGNIDDGYLALLCTSEAFLVYDYIGKGQGRGGVFRKMAQFKNAEAAGACSGVFYGANRFFAVNGSKLQIFNHQIGTFSDILDSNDPNVSHVENATPVCVQPISTQQVLLCYEKIGLVVDFTDKTKVERMFLFK